MVGARGSHKLKLAPLLALESSRSIEFDEAIELNHRYVALGDAKYKDLISAIQSEGVSQWSDITSSRLRTGDQYQMYAYLRLQSAAPKAFIVPFWEEGGPAVAQSEQMQFRRSPLDDDAPHALRVLGLNLMVEPTRFWPREQAAGGVVWVDSQPRHYNQ